MAREGLLYVELFEFAEGLRRLAKHLGAGAVTGPAGNMLTRMAGGTTPGHVASCYTGLVDALVIDESDAPATAEVELVITDTRMRDRAAEQALAGVVLEAAGR